jgi:hypothetical protein
VRLSALGQLATVAAAVLPISDAAWRRHGDGGGSLTLPQVPVAVWGTAHCPTGSCGA